MHATTVSVRDGSPSLAAWFLTARAQGKLPTEPFELAPAVIVTEPETLYDWIADVIERGDAGAPRSPDLPARVPPGAPESGRARLLANSSVAWATRRRASASSISVSVTCTGTGGSPSARGSSLTTPSATPA